MNPPLASYSITACFRALRIDCGNVAAASVAEAISRMKERKAAWAAKALSCRVEQIVWEAEEDFL